MEPETASPRLSEPHVHVVPLRLLLAIGTTLIALTLVTVAVTRFDLGRLNLVVAMGIAVVKATLVALYFMHLRWEKPLYTTAFIVSLGCVALFVLLTVVDTLESAPDRIPDYAPAVNR